MDKKIVEIEDETFGIDSSIVNVDSWIIDVDDSIINFNQKNRRCRCLSLPYQRNFVYGEGSTISIDTFNIDLEDQPFNIDVLTFLN